MPYFTIVIPVFNREIEIVRAVESCLSQSFRDFEVMVVDDGSSDQSIRAVKNISDSRVKIVCHEENRGVCPARNTGIDHSQGEWILLLDSDDELVADSLMKIYQAARDCPDGIDRLGFLYRRDDDRMSPEPIFLETVLNYEGYIAWRGGLILSDFFHCTRRRTFRKIRFAQGRAYEETYLLDFAKVYQTKLVPEVVALVHFDSANRASNLSTQQRMAAFLRDAVDQEKETAYILQQHGEALKRHSPDWYQIYRKAFILYCLLSGNRGRGTKLTIQYLAEYPFSAQGWVIWLIGLISPRLLARVKAWKVRTCDVGKA